MRTIRNLSVLFCFLIAVPSCSIFSGSGSGLEERNKEVTVQINALRLNVFDATSQVFINHGFSITTTNERLGLISTDYKDIEKTVGGAIFSGLFGRQDLQVMLTTNIRSSETGCILSILPKGRAIKASKLKEEYVEMTLSESFINNIEAMAQEIKNLAEKSGGVAADNQPQNKKEITETKQENASKQANKEENISKNQPEGTMIIVIKVPNANIRKQPSIQSPVIMSVTQGTQLKLIGIEGEWCEVIVEGKAGLLTGYINKALGDITKK